MGKLPKPRAMRTPGSYQLEKEKDKEKDREKDREKGREKGKSKSPNVKVGRPTKKKSGRKNEKRRVAYSREDMKEAIRLVLEEGMLVTDAALEINTTKKNVVKRTTLGDLVRAKRRAPPPLGRPQELSAAVEISIVECLEMVAEFQFPMTKSKLQDLVQDYCEENSVETSWKDNRPGRHWIASFKRRWSDRIKVKKASNIKRSRARVSPADVQDFFHRLQPNIEGLPPTHIFNYDESPVKDDPGAEATFVSRKAKYHEQVMNTSKLSYSLMFCCNAAGQMLPPMVVYANKKGSVYNNWIKGGPRGTAYAATPTGWFNKLTFEQFFAKERFYFFRL